MDKFKCNYCDAAFARKAQLKQHEEYRHNIVTSNNNAKTTSNEGLTNNNKANSILKKKKIGNVRIIQLSNGDRTFQEVGQHYF